MATTTTKLQHYTATVSVTEVLHKTEDGYNARPGVERVTQDVTQIVLRAKTLEGLKAQLSAHIQLIGDDL